MPHGWWCSFGFCTAAPAAVPLNQRISHKSPVVEHRFKPGLDAQCLCCAAQLTSSTVYGLAHPVCSSRGSTCRQGSTAWLGRLSPSLVQAAADPAGWRRQHVPVLHIPSSNAMLRPKCSWPKTCPAGRGEKEVQRHRWPAAKLVKLPPPRRRGRSGAGAGSRAAATGQAPAPCGVAAAGLRGEEAAAEREAAATGRRRGRWRRRRRRLQGVATRQSAAFQ